MRFPSSYRVVVPLLCACLLGERAGADDWQVKRKGTSVVFAQRYKRILEGRPELGFIFKRLLQVYGPKGGAETLADEYKAKVEKEPQRWQLRVLYGHFLRHLGKHEEAAKAYAAARDAAKDEFLPAFALAELHALTRDATAGKAYEAALALAPSDDKKRECLTKLAALALREGKVEKAKEHFRAMLAVAPKDLQAREDLAGLLARHGLFKEALAEYEAVRKRIRLDNLKLALVLREIGGLRDKLGEPEESIAAYRRALKLLTKTHWLRRELGERVVDVHRRRGTLAELVAELKGKRDPESLFTLAKLHEELGQEVLAIKTLRRALKARPKSSEARLKLIDLLEGQQRADEALAEYRALVKRDAGDPEHRLRLARAYLRRGQRSEAQKALRAAEKKFKKSVPVLKAVADLYGKHGLTKDARRVFERLVDLDPRDPELRRELGDLLLREGKLADAEKNWGEVVDQDASRAQGLVRLAQIYLGHNLVDRAIETLEKAVAADAQNVPARIDLARALAKAGRAEDALRAWKEAHGLATDPQHLRTAERQLVALWEQQGMLGEVAVELRDAFAQNKKDLKTGRLLAALLVKTKSYAAAEDTLKAILEAAPDDVEALLDLEKLYAARGEIGRARDFVVRAARLDKRRAKRHYRRAVEYTLKIETPKEAALLARRVVELNPVDAEAHAQLAELLEKAGRRDEAIQVYTRAIQLSPGELKYQLALGDLQRKAGKSKEAFATYRAVIAGSTDEAVVIDATKRLVRLGREQGRVDEVERELKQLSAANPKSMAHYQALAELYRSMGRQGEVDALLERASRRTTDRSGALGLLAQQAREKGDVRRAISYMRRQILEASKPSASQYRALAELYFELGDTPKARNVIEEMIRTVGDKARAWQTAAGLYQKYQMPDEALAALAKQVEHNPTDLPTKLKLAKSYIDADRLRDAEKLLKEIVDSAIGVGPSLGRRATAPVQPTSPVAIPRHLRYRMRGPFIAGMPQPGAQPAAPTTANAGELRRDALSLLVGIYERWGSADALTTRLEKGLADRAKARQLLSDLVAIYRLRGQPDKVAELLGRGVAMFPKEPAWLGLLAEVEAERGRLAEAVKIYVRLEKDVDPSNARRWAEKRVELHLENDQEKRALAAVDAYAKTARRPVGFLTRVAELLSGRGNFKAAVSLLRRAGKEDDAARAMVRDKLVEYLIAAGQRAEAATTLLEALDEEAKAPIANPTGVYAHREKKLRRYFELVDRIAREKLVLRRQDEGKAEPKNLLYALDVHLLGVMLGNDNFARERLGDLLALGYRDKQLVSIALERLVIAADFATLGPAVEKLFGILGESQERKRIAEVALGHMRTHRRVPPEALAEALVGAQLGTSPTASDHRSMGELYAAWGNFGKAASYYEEALRRSPGDADLYRELGRLYQQMGRAADARALFQRALAKGVLQSTTTAPVGADPLERALHRTRELLAYYRSAGQADAYERKLQEAVDKAPDDAAAHYELAGLFQNLGHRGRTLATIEKLSRTRPNDAEVLEVLGRLYQERGDYRTAAKLYEDALKLGSFRKRNLYRQLIFAYRRFGEEKKAFELEKQMAWEMGDEFALYRLALQLQKDGQIEPAIKAYKRYLSLKYSRYAHLSSRRRTLRVALELSKFLVRAGKAPEAARELEAYLPMVRGIPVASFERRNFIQRLTGLYQQQGVLTQKLAAWEERSKSDSFFLDLLYHFHESRGNAEEKLRLLERTVALRPRDEARVEALADEYARRGRYDDAIAALKRLEGVASSPSYLLRIGNLYHYKGQRDLARASWKRHVDALFTYPTYRDYRSRRLFALAEILDREGYRAEAETARIDAVDSAAAVDAYQYGRIIGEYVRRSSYDSALTIAWKALEKVVDPQQRRNLLYALLPYGYYAVKHLQGLRDAVAARKLFDGAEKEGDPRGEVAHLFYDILGERYRSAGNEGKAAEAFEMALGYKDDADTQRNLIGIYKRLNKEREVARIYERLLERKPDHAPYLRAAAEAYFKAKEFDRALPLLERDLKLAPTSESALKLFEIHKARGKAGDALPALVAARVKIPGSMDLLERIEEAHRALGDAAKLDAFYEEVGRGVPIPPADLARLAALIERGGKIFSAVQVYKTAYVSASIGTLQNRQAQEKLTQTLTRLGHPDLADEELLRELPHAFQRYQVHERLAGLLEQHGMGEKALGQLKRAVFLAPQLASLWRRTIEVARGLGLAGETKALVAWARSLHPADASIKTLAAEPLPVTGPKTALRRVLWRRPLGACAVAPVVAGDVVVTVECPREGDTTAKDAGPVLVGRRLDDGARVWKEALPKPPARIERDGGVVQWRNRVVALARAGDLVVAAINEDQFERVKGVGTGRVRRFHLLGLRAATGERAWLSTHAGDYAGGPIALAGETLFVHGQNLRAFSMRTGRALWSRYAGSNVYGWIFEPQNASRPAAGSGAVFAAGKDGRLYAFDAQTGTPRWMLRAAAPLHASPLHEGDAVYVLGDDGWLYAAGAEDGKLRWKRFVGGDAREETVRYGDGYYTRPRQRGRPAADQERVYVATGAGLVTALARADGRVLWQRKLADRTARDLRLDGARLFVAGERGALYALDAQTGVSSWQYLRPTGAPVVVAGGTALAVLGDDHGYAREHRVVALDFANDAALRQRAQALASLAERLEREHDQVMLDALLRNVASPIDSDFRPLHERLMNLRADAGDVGGVLQSGARLLALRDGDWTWTEPLRAALTRAFERAPQPVLPVGTGPTRAAVHRALPTDFEGKLRLALDGMPVDERARGLAGEILLAQRAVALGDRLTALGRIRALRARAAIPYLYEIATKPEGDVASLAAVALAELDDYSAKEPLREALRAQQVGRRRAAALAISKSASPDDLPALRVAVTDTDAPVRSEAAFILARSEPNPAAMSVLRQHLRQGDDELRIKAALALGQLGEFDGLPVLQELSRVRRGVLQAQAADALFELGARSALPILLDHRTREAVSTNVTTLRLVIGNIHLLLEDDRAALLEYRSLLSFDPDLDKAWAKVGALYLLRGRTADAVAPLSEALRRNPFLVSPRIHRALARARLGDLKAARRDLELAFERNPEIAEAHAAKVELLVRAGELEAAQKAEAEVLERFAKRGDVHDAMARLRLGEAGAAFAKLDVAVKLARQAIALAPSAFDHHLTLAEIELARGRLDAAERAVHQALRLAVGEGMRARAFKVMETIRGKRAPIVQPAPAKRAI